ncbi:hypothetical protein BIZ50_02510 [Helicobacter pylori]|nr:hypothetical protein BIZ44_02335 [Helicobacter pylori]OLR48183.1 hypothetical protein BIZ50_02510 [Helicobacter pylori]
MFFHCFKKFYFIFLSFILKIIFLSILIGDNFLAILTALKPQNSSVLKVNLEKIMEGFSNRLFCHKIIIRINHRA